MMSSSFMHIAVLFASFCSVTYGSPFERVGGQCLTIGGAQVGVPCVFPFKARGITYTECTTAGGFSTPWCSTKVDASGNTVLGNYGDCPASDADCYPTTQATTAAADAATGPCITTGGADVGVSCVFPFKARGITYTSCTFAGGFSTPWCSTKVDADGNTVLGNYGDCPMNDPTCPNDAATTPPPETSPAETSPAETTPAPCLTTGGADVGVPCVFPFKARGITYTSCTFAGGFTTPWCSTKVDADGNTVLGNYGDCPLNDPTCPNDAATTPAPETSPAETSPAETSPAETSPAETSPAETSPAETSPAETSPAETSPAETSPAETSPAETSPAETSPAETSPAETSPAETSPAETSPAETSPAAETAAETSPAETSPVETSPAETSPAETSPAETSPAETSPAETSPAETSPAETSPAAETTVAACMTVSGAKVGVPCVFPFTDPRGNTYTSCTVAGGYDTPWCATKVDGAGLNILGNWGECPLDDPTCPNDITTMEPTMASSSAAPTTESTTAAAAPDGNGPVRKRALLF